MARTPKNFCWRRGDPLPRIEPHTGAKLDVLRNYLRTYFDTVACDPRMDTLNITLVDGFCGGGAYQDGVGERSGSPLVMLEEVAAAEARINASRTKPFTIDARFVFVDSSLEHLEVLREVLHARGHDPFSTRITLLPGELGEQLPGIIARIATDQRAGRSIFFLDQLGYTAVAMEDVRTIFAGLNRAEVILNFAIDGLLNYLTETAPQLHSVAQFGVDERFVREWLDRDRNARFGKMMIQRTLMERIAATSGARFFTPFLLWSQTDNRHMMLAHMAQHQAARDKMLGVHWAEQNMFAHFGSGSLYALGYDHRLVRDEPDLFAFEQADRTNMCTKLTGELPREIRDRLGADGEIAVADLLMGIGNRTAGTNRDITNVLGELVVGRELDLISKDGKVRRRGSQIYLNDRIRLAREPSLFSLPLP